MLRLIVISKSPAGDGAVYWMFWVALAAKECGADRVELYTAAYADQYPADPAAAIAPYVAAARAARDCGLGLNAGHDLSLENLAYFVRTIPWTDEVSIGHALISDALYMGLEKTVAEYLRLTHANK